MASITLPRSHTAPIVVFRVQDASGRGPFRLGFSRCWVQDRPDHQNLVPWFAEFGRVERTLQVGEHIGCGCQTQNQLRRWFTPQEYGTLCLYGYHAVQMRVSRLLGASDIQCVFARSRPLNADIVPFELY